MSDWDDLFAAAEAPTESSFSLDPPPATTSKKSKKRKRKQAKVVAASRSAISQPIEFPPGYSIDNTLSYSTLVTTSSSPISELLANVRNIRFIAAEKRKKAFRDLARMSAACVSLLAERPLPELPTNERTVLLEKARVLHQTAALTCNVKQHSDRIAIIIAADAVYYRLFYALNITNNASLIPPPTAYFSLLCDVDVDDRLKGLATTNPLLCLFELRKVETDKLFKKYSNDQSTISAHLNARSAAEEENSVACAPLLGRWRDSVRDLPCNIYSYATLTETNLDTIVDFCTRRGAGGVVEMGAGTGYVSRLLSDRGLNVSAYDIALSGNEYHGHVSPYFDVVEGDVRKLRGGDVDDKALLLCYPPPDNSMGEDALNAFVGGGASSSFTSVNLAVSPAQLASRNCCRRILTASCFNGPAIGGTTARR